MKQLYKRGGVISSVLILLLSLYLPLSLFSCKSDDDDDSPTYYTITISSSIENGSVEASKKSASSGESIKLTAKPATGYEFDSYSVTDSKGSTITVTNGEFKMPASSVTVSATFKETQATIDANAAAAVIAKINAIGTVAYTSDSKTKIDDARSAYDALSSDQKALVTNFSTLTTAESSYSELKTAADNQAAAADVIAKINAIGTVAYTSDSKTKIDDARTAYDALTNDQKALVTNYSTLTTAESSYESLAPVAVTAITLNKTETSIKVGATETLSVTAVAPDNATDKTYTWKTSDASKATVTAEGVVTAVAEGTVTIYAEANDGSGVKGNCTVTVTPATVTSPLDNTTTAWTSGTFAVPAGGLTYSDAITVSGDVTLTLTDGETLTLNKGISLAEGATLTVEGTGTMNVNGTNGNASSTVAGTGTIVLTSGTLNAKGGNGEMVPRYGTSSNPGGVAINGAVTVEGGTLTATGGTGGHLNTDGYVVNARAGAGGAAISGDVIITDGTVTATGGNGGNDAPYASGAIAGAGGVAIGGNVTLTGGTLTTVNGSAGTKRGDGTVGAGGNAVAGTVTDNR